MRVLWGFVAAMALAGPGFAQDVDAGRDLFQHHCAVCHGTAANGTGPMAPVLTIQPTDLTTLAARNGGVFPVARVAMRIDGREPLVSHGSPMPVYGDFFVGPEALGKTETGQPLLTTRPVADLIAWLNSIQD
jgi:mono/diheme cytochrome c family protein